jgi:hypothetical protein
MNVQELVVTARQWSLGTEGHLPCCCFKKCMERKKVIGIRLRIQKIYFVWILFIDSCGEDQYC